MPTLPKIEDIFTLHTAKSTAYEGHTEGSVPFVSNGLSCNGVVGLVRADPRDRVFTFSGICISAFAEATPHKGPFIARGNGGSGLLVLEPKHSMTEDHLIRVAAFINNQIRWRFSWSRQVTANRFRSVMIPDALPATGATVGEVLPPSGSKARVRWSLNPKTYRLDELFDLTPGYYHALNQLGTGSVPIVSCSGVDNGIAGYYSVDPSSLHRAKLTIALNGSPLLTTWHPYTFAGKDDVAVCTPKAPLRVTTLCFIQALLNREQWRFSYYRKCYLGKLKSFSIQLPCKENGIDEETIAAIVEAAPYWDYIAWMGQRSSATP